MYILISSSHFLSTYLVTALHKDPSTSNAELRLQEALNCDKDEVPIFFKIYMNEIISLYTELHEYVAPQLIKFHHQEGCPSPNLFSIVSAVLCAASIIPISQDAVIFYFQSFTTEFCVVSRVIILLSVWRPLRFQAPNQWCI